MANEVMIPEVGAIPAYLQKVLAENAALIQANLDAADGISTGALPRIVAKQGMFIAKVDGVEQVIQMNVPGMGLINAPKIPAIILKGKKTLSRAWFAAAYSAGSEPVSPDCSSDDGVKPRPDSPNPQCTSCAGCPMNAWGSAKMQDGSPGKGKACAEKKRLAIYANNGVFAFDIPPASLGDFAAYVNQLTAHGLPLASVVTTISFDPNAPTKLVFAYQGYVPEAAVGKVMGMIESAEVKAIIEDRSTPALPAPAAQADDSAAKAEEAKKAAEAAAAAEAKKKADAEKKAAAAAAKKAKDEAEKAAAAAAQQPGLDLGLDLGMGGDAAPAPQAAGEIADDELAALFAV